MGFSLPLFKAVAIASLSFAGPAFAEGSTLHVVQYEDHGAGHRQVIQERTLGGAAQNLDYETLEESSRPQYVIEHEPLGSQRIVTLKSPSAAVLARVLAERGVAPMAPRPETEELADEVMTLVNNGPSANRIDLVFLGDGYTQAERAKFFADINRIVRDMFEGETFQSYLPLFNVHAVFHASNVSGIGVNDQPKDTAYGLAREGATLRAIFLNKPDAARASCNAAPDCDYPVVIGNDAFYGGLGGEFAISTSSETSGTVVLRHELGHTFGDVGEEYDGGGYFGANSSPSVASLKWRAWTSTDSVTAEPVVSKILAWPWYNLSQGTYAVNWTSDGTAARYAVRYSASGLPTDDALSITLDGQPIPFHSRGDQDRMFNDVEVDQGLPAGRHELKFTETAHDGDNWVSSLTVHEFGAAYHYDNDYIGAYPVMNANGSVAAYRPTHESCLMRDMKSHSFCKICQENLWLKFFAKVKLIDDLTVTRDGGNVTAHLATQNLGAQLQVKWFKAGVEVPALAGHAVWTLPAADAAGRWEARVEFQTPEVRPDPRGLLKDKRAVTI